MPSPRSVRRTPRRPAIRLAVGPWVVSNSTRSSVSVAILYPRASLGEGPRPSLRPGQAGASALGRRRGTAE
eukprot:2950239-Pyramimonas_sp.AAC.1